MQKYELFKKKILLLTCYLLFLSCQDYSANIAVTHIIVSALGRLRRKDCHELETNSRIQCEMLAPKHPLKQKH